MNRRYSQFFRTATLIAVIFIVVAAPTLAISELRNSAISAANKENSNNADISADSADSADRAADSADSAYFEKPADVFSDNRYATPQNAASDSRITPHSIGDGLSGTARDGGAPMSENGAPPDGPFPPAYLSAARGASAATPPTPTPAPTPDPTPDPGYVLISITGVGDCTLGYDDGSGAEGRFDRVYDSKNDPAYFFSGVKSYFESDDITIANLEGTFTTSKQKADKTFCFHGDPEYAKILTEGDIEAVSIANNHTMDYFSRGFDDTVAALDGVGVTHFGGDSVKIITVKGVKVGLAGFHVGSGGWSHRQKQIDSALAKLNAEADMAVFSIHWGVETKYTPTGDQKTLARYCIDNGADLILGHHPHTLQGIETYGDRTVAYSLGNFCFGGNRNPKDKDTMIFRQSFAFDLTDAESPKLIEIKPYEALPASISSTSGRNDYRPTVLTGDEGARVSSKIADLSK